jgi:endonuclease G
MTPKKLFYPIITALLGLTILMSACDKTENNVLAPVTDTTVVVPTTPTTPPVSTVDTTTLNEGFEQGSKAAYATGTASFASGSWNLNDALVGTTTADGKSGLQSVRIRNTGSLTMLFDRKNGAIAVGVKHCTYGNDGASTWELYVSTNSGSVWTKVGNTVTSSSATLSTATFTLNVQGNIRLEIRKVSGGTNRINIDDILISNSNITPTTPPVTPPVTPPSPSNEDNLALGNPSAATTSISSPDNYLLTKVQYSISYNNSKHIPNWVSWRCASEWIGSTGRQDNFRADATLPANWFQCDSAEFSGSGFDRGHMCPSGDRTSSTTDNSATFLMTNMIPQAPNNNQFAWADLENYCRSLMASGNELYIICGGYGQGGTGKNGYKTTVGNGTWIPNKTWKVIVILPVGSNDAARVTTSTRVIAVLMPNDQTCNSKPWQDYRVSVDHIESLTGYDFLSNVSANIQADIEARVDN